MNADCPRYSAMLKEAYTGEETQQYLEDNKVTILEVLAHNEKLFCFKNVVNLI